MTYPPTKNQWIFPEKFVPFLGDFPAMITAVRKRSVLILETAEDDW